VFYCSSSHSFPFTDLGFVPYEENMWIKFNTSNPSIPHFAITTTINPTSMTFVIKDLIDNQMMSTNSYDSVKDFVISNSREDKLKKILED